MSKIDTPVTQKISELGAYTLQMLMVTLAPGAIQDATLTAYAEKGYYPALNAGSWSVLKNMERNSLMFLAACQNTEALREAYDDRNAIPGVIKALLVNPWLPSDLESKVLQEVDKFTVSDWAEVHRVGHAGVWVNPDSREVWFLTCPTERKEFIYRSIALTNPELPLSFPLYTSPVFGLMDIPLMLTKVAAIVGSRHSDGDKENWVNQYIDHNNAAFHLTSPTWLIELLEQSGHVLLPIFVAGSLQRGASKSDLDSLAPDQRYHVDQIIEEAGDNQYLAIQEATAETIPHGKLDSLLPIEFYNLVCMFTREFSPNDIEKWGWMLTLLDGADWNMQELIATLKSL